LRAFETLIERHREVVFRVAARIVGPHDAEDVSQDAFLRAFHRLSAFRGEAPFRSWLLQIVHNAALNALARRTTRTVALGDEQGEPEAGWGGPADRLESRERQERLQDKLGLMPAMYRELVVLRDLEGLSYDEIAQVAQMPLGSVKGRLHRARAQLIDLLRHNTYDWELPE
jgi:RNA polymerase sigma-70 factor (ECF subfamily)